MKTQLSSLDIYYLLKEMNIDNSKVQQIYEIGKKDIIIQLHKTGTGKVMLRITPAFFYQTENKPEVEPPKGFVMGLRKHLKNSILKSIKQINFERIIELEFQTKDSKLHLYIELFGKGNIILTSKDMNIINLAEQQRWKDRTIKPGIPYTYPKNKHNLLKLTKQELKNIIGKENIGKTIAKLGIGKTFSNEVLTSADIEKTKIKLSEKEITALNNSLKDIKSREIKPIITDDDILPFSTINKGIEAESFNSAFDKVFAKEHKKTITNASESKYEKQLKKITNIIENQEKQVNKMAKSAEESQKIGESIYSNYQLIDEILNQIKTAREKLSWKEIKEKLKGHKIIKEINEKESIISIEIKNK